MLFLILNRVEISPYIDKNGMILNDRNHFPNDEYQHYNNIYKEFTHSTWFDDLYYTIGIIVSLIGIWHFSKEISKSIHHSE